MALSSSGNCQESVSLESSVHSMTSSSWPLMKSMMPIRLLSSLRTLHVQYEPAHAVFRRGLYVLLEPPRDGREAGAHDVGRDHVLEPELAIVDSRKGTFRLTPHAQQLDRERRIDL